MIDAEVLNRRLVNELATAGVLPNRWRTAFLATPRLLFVRPPEPHPHTVGQRPRQRPLARLTVDDHGAAYGAFVDGVVGSGLIGK